MVKVFEEKTLHSTSLVWPCDFSSHLLNMEYYRIDKKKKKKEKKKERLRSLGPTGNYRAEQFLNDFYTSG